MDGHVVAWSAAVLSFALSLGRTSDDLEILDAICLRVRESQETYDEKAAVWCKWLIHFKRAILGLSRDTGITR